MPLYLCYYDEKSGRNSLHGPFLNVQEVRLFARQLEIRFRPCVLCCACLDEKRKQLFTFVVSSFVEV